MKSLAARIESFELLQAMEPEEIGMHLLATLRDDPGQQGMYILSNALQPLASGYPLERRDQAMDIIAEAWAWLESQALLVPARSQLGHAPWRVISRRGRSLTTHQAYTGFRVASLLPKELLHPAIPSTVWPNFLRGDYDTAVFQAMRQVEIALRDVTGFEETSGVKLARRAFHSDNGPLTDPNAEGGEKQALMDLFTGALGTLKNPHSHRNVQLERPADAAAAIMLASYLLRTIDDRAFDAPERES